MGVPWKLLFIGWAVNLEICLCLLLLYNLTDSLYFSFVWNEKCCSAKFTVVCMCILSKRLCSKNNNSTGFGWGVYKHLACLCYENFLFHTENNFKLFPCGFWNWFVLGSVFSLVLIMLSARLGRQTLSFVACLGYRFLFVDYF